MTPMRDGPLGDCMRMHTGRCPMQSHIIAQLSARDATLSRMRKIGDIHVFEDQAFLHAIKRDSALVFELGIVAGVVWACAITALREFRNAPLVPFELGDVLGTLGLALMGVEGEASPSWVWWISLALAIVATLALHELVHAFFFKQFAPPGAHISFGANMKTGMIYASATDIVYSRAQYEVIALAPTVVVTALVFAIGFGFTWPLWTLLVAVAHLSGCTGDWEYVRAIRRDGRITHCRDTEWGVEFYSDAPIAQERARVVQGGSSATRNDKPVSVSAPAPTSMGVSDSTCSSTSDSAPASDASVGQDEASKKRAGFSVVDGGKSS